ncbi:MAG: S24 family peptidase [Chloroflexota bacterium]
MVIRLPGFTQQSGPQLGPEPAWARFSVEGGEQHQPRKVRMQAYKPDVAAYRVLGAERRSEAEVVAERVRNRHNSSVYISSMVRGAGKQANLAHLPVIGEIAAGQYDVTVAFQDYDCLDGGVAVDKGLARGGAYALRVRGTSMTHVGIEPGDVVIIRPQNWAENGDFVVANYSDGEAGGSEGLATLKRFYKRRDHVFLQSATASTDPIRLFAGREADRDPVRVQGVVTMVLKSSANN